MVRLALAAVTYVVMATAATAQNVAPIDTLYRALGFDDLLEIMREEGLGNGRDMQSDLLGGRGGARWPETVSEIYDVTRMAATIRNRMDTELAASDLAPMIAFFDSEIGREIISLEVSARAAFLEEEIEEASADVFASMVKDEDPRVALIEDLVEVADLIDSNVAGALNSNYAFYVGLAEGGGLQVEMSESQILADVWGQEAEIRQDTTDWIYSYLNMAYTPLSDEDVVRYIDFYGTEAGRALNRAIFAAFDELFTEISFELGQSASDYLAGEEL